jgi:serine/threonine-protein kinase
MTPERWSRVSAIFDAAVELTPQRRAAFLAQACGEDSDLRAEVERLLVEEERTKGLRDEPVVPSPAGSRKHNGDGAASQATKRLSPESSSKAGSPSGRSWVQAEWARCTSPTTEN